MGRAHRRDFCHDNKELAFLLLSWQQSVPCSTLANNASCEESPSGELPAAAQRSSRRSYIPAAVQKYPSWHCLKLILLDSGANRPSWHPAGFPILPSGAKWGSAAPGSQICGLPDRWARLSGPPQLVKRCVSAFLALLKTDFA